jgi:pimeloyl-ACP methyl ester carboxylesterase
VRKRRLLRLAGAGLTAAAAAVTAGVVVERRVVRARKAGAPRADELGGLRGTVRRIAVDGDVELYAEVDEIAPYADEAAGTHRPDEATLVFVHGYALNLDCWHFQRAAFRGKRRMVFYDQRSHGRSDRSHRDAATIDQLGRDLLTVLDELVPTGPVVLVGHSMGGMTILALAEQHPELFGDRIVGTALISTTAGGLRPHRIISTYIPDSVGSLVGPRLIAGLARAPELIDSARRRGSNIGFLVTDTFAFGDDVPASYVEFVDNMLAGTPFEVLAEFFPNFESLDKFAVLASFARIPTTIVCGTKDLLTSVGHSRKMAKQITGARLVEAVGAGHMVILERADKVNTALQELLERAETQAGRKAS